MSRILIVEDDPEQARALSRAFSKLRPDLAILTAANGAEAMRLVSERSVDVVLTDLQMPEMDGFELIRWLHAHRPDIAVFSMSAYGAPSTAAQVGALGAIEYFAKPVDPSAVLARLTDSLAQAVCGQVHYVSLASFLQLLEMERKTCTLTVSQGDKTGLLAIRNGVLVAARTAELQGQAAAISIVAWSFPSIVISRHCDDAPSTIQSSLGFIVMEAMRVQDEAARASARGADGNGSAWPAPRRTWRPSIAPSDRPAPESSRGRNGEAVGLPSGARGLALVETTTGNVLRAASRDDCPIGELARMASQLLLQEAATLQLSGGADGEGVEELVLSTSSRCDVIRPINVNEFALLVYAPEETNLVMARIELEHFIATHR
jgi:CheY-like chemotaxis protein